MTTATDDKSPTPAPSRRALGKGLDSLLPRVTAAATSAAEPETGKPMEIPVDQIDRNPYQTRSHFEEKQMEELAASITANGVVQPILVRPQANGRYQLIAGERRWLASKRAGKATVPAILRQVSNEQTMEITIIENLQRADLDPIEQARAFDRLGREFGMTQDQISIRTGKDRATISNFVRLLRLPEIVQLWLMNGKISFGHAKVLLALSSPEEIESAAKKVLSLSLSVRQTETYVQGLLMPEPVVRREPKPEPAIDPNVQDAQQRLQQALGLRVQIEDKGGRGRVVIDYARLEDFDALMERLTS